MPNVVRTLAAPADPPGLTALDNLLGNPVVNNVGNAGFDVVSWNVFNTIVSNILYNHTLDTAAAAGVAGEAGGAVGGGALVGCGRRAGAGQHGLGRHGRRIVNAGNVVRAHTGARRDPGAAATAWGRGTASNPR